MVPPLPTRWVKIAPRHYLVIRPAQPGQQPWEREWGIEHDPSCPAEWGSEGYLKVYRCAVSDEVGYSGLDNLDADWRALRAGRYEIELWRTEYDDGYDPRECESGLRVVRRAVVAVAISV